MPWPLHRILSGHVCATAQQKGWGGLKNGELLQKAEAGFDLFITADQNLRYQQALKGRRIAILELSTNKLRRLLNAGNEIVAAIASIQPGEFRHLQIS